MSEPAEIPRGRPAGPARLRRLIATIERGDEEAVRAALDRMSQSRRALAPLALALGAFAMLFRGLALLWVNWRLLLVEALPAMWVWATMLDLKAHVLRGQGFTERDVVAQVLLVVVASLVTAVSLYLNVVFAFAIGGRTAAPLRPAFAAAWGSRALVTAVGCSVGAAVGVSAFVVPRWGLGWFSLSLGVALAVMMLLFVLVPSRLVGVTRTGSQRDRLVAVVLAGVFGAVVCTPSYALGRFGILLLSSHGVLALGITLLVVGFVLQSGATAAVKAIKLSATLVRERAAPGADDPS